MALIKLNNRGVRNVSAFGSVAGGSMTFIKKLTASSSATLSFVDGTSDVVLDDTYKEYLFTFKNIHPSEQSSMSFNFRDGSTDYDATKTTTFFHAYHNEADSYAAMAYSTGYDIAQGTGFQKQGDDIDTENDANSCGYLHLFNPSSTTFVKHFMARISVQAQTQATDVYIGGYCNVTAAIDAVQFKMDSGSIDAGDICLYGIK